MPRATKHHDGNDISLKALLPYLTKELECPLRQPTLSSCTYQSAVGDHIGLESQQLRLMKELQGPLHHPTFSACAAQSVVGDHIGLETLLPESPCHPALTGIRAYRVH